MTLAEVEALLGGPAGRYGHPLRWSGTTTLLGVSTERRDENGQRFPGPPIATMKTWATDLHHLEVYFGPNGRVVATYARPFTADLLPGR